MTAFMLLGPGTPMLFQGQEFAASSPFHYFAHHNENLAKRVREGRWEFLRQFKNLADPGMEPFLADPSDPRVFQESKIDISERQRHSAIYSLHVDLIRLRREDPVFRGPRPRRPDGAVLGPHCLCLRFFGNDGEDRLIVMNLGLDLHLDPAPEPLLAPPEGMVWKIVWSSENPTYGGSGTPALETPENWRIPGHATVVLGSEKIVESLS